MQMRLPLTCCIATLGKALKSSRKMHAGRAFFIAIYLNQANSIADK